MGGATTVAELEEMLAKKDRADRPTSWTITAAADEPGRADDPPPPTEPGAGPDAPTSAAPTPEPGGRGAGAQPAGDRRGAELRRAAARRRRAGHLRDVGDRHRQVARRHLQRAAVAVDDGRREKMAQRLSERAEGTITVEDVTKAQTIEELSTTVREFLEAGELDGFVRTIRQGRESDDQVPVYVFHAAGGSTVVYEPLLKRLPAGTPMYGLERVEGTIEERAAQYVPKLLELNGWARAEGQAVHPGRLVAGRRAGLRLRDRAQAGRAPTCSSSGSSTRVRAGEEVPQTKEETRKRWDRYAKFAEKTFNVRDPGDPVRGARGTRRRGPGAVRPGRRRRTPACRSPAASSSTSARRTWTTARSTTVEIEPYDGHVTLYMADRYHDDAITFEPRYATRQPDGGWGEFVADLEVVPIGGEHIQAIDEPYIAKVGAHMSEAINRIQSEAKELTPARSGN